MSSFAKYSALGGGGGGAGLIVSINGDSTPAQVIAAGAGITVSSVSGTTTVAATGGNAITALTGDVTATGPGSVAATLATVNASPGTTGSATSVTQLTTNAKGLVTSNSSVSIQITESQVTNLTADLAAKAPSASPAFTGTIGTALTVNRTVQTDPSGNLATFAEFSIGSSGSSFTANWNNGPAQFTTLSANTSVTLSNPSSGQAYVLRFVQGASAFTVSWTTTIRWPGGIAPVISIGSGAIDIVKLYYDGTNYYGTFAQNFS